MPRSSNKNKNNNKNSNKIHITINNKSTSKRKRKGKAKQGGSNASPHYGNAMPTIIQMHQPQPTISQIADNRYGVSMSGKIDALSGGLTRVIENIENKQQEYYSREKNESFLQEALKSREDELRNQPPSSTGHLDVPKPENNKMETPFPARFLDKVMSQGAPLKPRLDPLTMNQTPDAKQLQIPPSSSPFAGQLDNEPAGFTHDNIYDNLDEKSIDESNPTKDKELSKKEKRKIAQQKLKQKTRRIE